METLGLLRQAIDYMDERLQTRLDIEDIAKAALSSKYHFQRMFHALTGFTVTEYIRNRRLTLAAEELACTDSKVIDVALKYGYENPEAFAKAFQRLDLTVLHLPAQTYAVFDSREQIPDDAESRREIINVWRRIYAEWFPSANFEQVGGPCIEKYYWVDESQADSICEVWIPIQRKRL